MPTLLSWKPLCPRPGQHPDRYGDVAPGHDFSHVPMLSRAKVAALVSGDAWLGGGRNLLPFGPPGSGGRTSPPRSDAAGWRTAIARCSPAPRKRHVSTARSTTARSLIRFSRRRLRRIHQTCLVSVVLRPDKRLPCSTAPRGDRLTAAFLTVCAPRHVSQHSSTILSEVDRAKSCALPYRRDSNIKPREGHPTRCAAYVYNHPNGGSPGRGG